MLTEVPPRLLSRFVTGAGLGSLAAVQRYERRRRRGEPYFPAFVFISVTNRCNLRCRGCWVTPEPATDMTPELLRHVIAESVRQGCRFFGILGGEPLLHGGLMDALASFPRCYFQLFTNGQTLDDACAARLARLGNVTPLISIEGGAAAHASRRGSADAFGRGMEAVAACRRARLVTGVATSVCRSSFDDVADDAFLEDLVGRGVHYLWYYIYRPAGSDPAVEEALSGAQIRSLRRFIVDRRGRHPLVIVDAYWNHMGEALCPAATGISIHVNPAGQIEPCPPVQFADRQASVSRSFRDDVASSQFLSAFRRHIPELTRGCLLLERPDALAPLVDATGAVETSGRGDLLTRLAAQRKLPGHDQEERYPERDRLTAWAKRNWFFGFGAYG